MRNASKTLPPAPVQPPALAGPPELWGGVECTYNRVGDVYFDQLERSGHATRVEDLDLFAALGIRAMRYPLLWERLAPDAPNTIHWDWADARLARLQALNIKPIVGLLHHGNGPRYTNLLDPDFAEGLATFARHVAERYPWIEDYTPINEPLTTARFCGLYGHWYPHGRDSLTFARVLLNQCRAIVLAMQAIRRINPAARLLQTEDIGKAFSTPALAYQAEFENQRRWLSFDLLCGRVNREHPLWHYLRWVGIPAGELEIFLDEPCPPDVIGIDYYVSSERFLDERLEHYPPHEHGGNGWQSYADVAAVRVCEEGLAGLEAIARETWQRYGLPLAMTEAHLGCTREEQMRWMMEVWHTAQALRHAGVEMRAVTAWAMLGAHDWNTLVTSDAGLYEPGAFDLRSPHPRPTALAHMLLAFSQHSDYQHPVLAVPGWWHRPERLIYHPTSRAAQPVVAEQEARGALAFSRVARPSVARPILITGGHGTLGDAFAHICHQRGLSYCALSHRELNITDAAPLETILKDLNPWAIINAAGYIHLDEAERQPQRCWQANVTGPAVLAQACAQRGLPLLTFSSDQVFDGAQRQPYLESDRVSPLNVYGRSKVEMEAQALQILPRALIIRSGVFFGPWSAQDFLTNALRTLAAGYHLPLAEDATVGPIYVPDLVGASLDLLLDNENGIWHLGHGAAITWVDWVQQAAQRAGIDAGRIEPRPTWALGLTAPRPLYNVLGSERGQLLPLLEDALNHYVHVAAFHWQEAARQRQRAA